MGELTGKGIQSSGSPGIPDYSQSAETPGAGSGNVVKIIGKRDGIAPSAAAIQTLGSMYAATHAEIQRFSEDPTAERFSELVNTALHLGTADMQMLGLLYGEIMSKMNPIQSTTVQHQAAAALETALAMTVLADGTRFVFSDKNREPYILRGKSLDLGGDALLLFGSARTELAFASWKAAGNDRLLLALKLQKIYLADKTISILGAHDIAAAFDELKELMAHVARVAKDKPEMARLEEKIVDRAHSGMLSPVERAKVCRDMALLKVAEADFRASIGGHEQAQESLYVASSFLESAGRLDGTPADAAKIKRLIASTTLACSNR